MEMGREDCERIIIKKMHEIMGTYHQYNPDGERLTMYVIGDHYSVDNIYWADDAKHPLSAWESDKWGFTQGSLNTAKDGAEA